VLSPVPGRRPRWSPPFAGLGKDAIDLLGHLGKEAEEAGRRVSKSGFESSVLRELSVGLCRGNYYMYCVVWGLTKVTGHAFRAGADRPTDEVV
jgi:hypothetical protein